MFCIQLFHNLFLILTVCSHYLGESPKQVAENSDIIFSIVGYPQDVKSTILDETTGVISGTSTNKNQIIVDMTTSEPSLAKEIAQQCSTLKVSCLGKFAAIMVTHDVLFPTENVETKEEKIQYLRRFMI